MNALDREEPDVPASALTSQRHPMAPCPRGWYALALGSDLRPGTLRARQFAGREVVMYRTAQGRAVVADAHCPHLGAHFADYGRVEGEALLCTFHGFRFGCDGACTATGYGTRPPPRAQLRTYPTRERNGALLAWYSPDGAAPNWEVPALEWQGFRAPLTWFHGGLEAHAQDMTENSVDMGHFRHAHFFRDIEMLEPLALEGPSMRLHYAFKRPADPVKGTGTVMQVRAQITAWGIGFTVAEAAVERFGLRSRVIVYHTPTTAGRIDVWVQTALRSLDHPERMHPLLGKLPRRLVEELVTRQIHGYTTRDIQRDFPYLAHKRYLTRPALAEGDGPIGRFRAWARQFYPEGPTP